MNKRKGLYATIEPFKKKVVKQLKAYYFQGGKWYAVSSIGGKRL